MQKIKFLMASGNPHKAQELNDLFHGTALSIEAADKTLDVVEDGNSYHENALLKARAYYNKYKCPVIADDSGLNVIALPDELGLYSARFGGDKLNYHEKCELLLQKMQEEENRNASFYCVLVCYFSPDEYYFFEGQLQGAIGHKILGTEGFGFDPVFHPTNAPEEKTLAQLPEWKQINSHRARAAHKVKTFFKSFQQNCCH